MGHSWLDQRERGNVFAMRLIVWLSLRLGRRVGRLLLYPICLYFMFFTPRARHASQTYLHHIFGRMPGWREVFHHFYVFASVLLDRAFLLGGRHDYFEVNKYGLDQLREVLDQGRGCLFLGAHVGSFELVRFGGASTWGLTINLMMYEENARKIKRVVESLTGGVHLRILPIGGLDSLMQARERLGQGEMLAILGDRAVGADKMIHVPFMGQQVAFPVGPILAANALKVPVVLFFGLYRGGNRYEEHFELLADHITVERATRHQDLTQWVARYAERLEHYCRMAPYNWFNFYDFWAQSTPASEEDGEDAAQLPDNRESA